MAGKWHLDLVAGTGGKGKHGFGVDKNFMPHAQGFDEYWRGEMKQYYASHGLNGEPFADAPHSVSDNRFRVVVQTEAALSFLDRRAKQPGQPWFLYLAWFAPHVPLESPEPWFSKTPTNLPLLRRQALSMIAAMDDGLGQIRAKLRAMNAETNTLIFFIGDNGAPLGDAWDGSLNLPLVGQKGMLADGGIRTPFVAAWPGRIPAGRVYEHPVINLDVAATANAVAGLPHDKKLDGVNLLPYLTGEKSGAPHDTLYWRWSSQAAILEMPYKFILLGYRERLLFDVTQPDGENTARNLAARHPGIATRLETKLRAWCDALRPPGITTSFDKHHEELFKEHGIIEKRSESAAQLADPAQGWICRSGTLSIRDGALVIAQATNNGENARAFLTHPNLDIAGPVEVSLVLRATKGGISTFTWRTKSQADFTAANTVDFEWPSSSDWTEIKATLPVNEKLIHLRITPPRDSAGLEIRTIQLAGKKAESQRWDFGATK